MNIVKIILVFAFVVCINQDADAQRGRSGRGKTAAATAKEKTAEDLLFEEMLSTTAKVLVIDSIVTPKADFLNHIPLGKESGTLVSYNDYFKTGEQPGAYVYINEFGNKRYYSKNDTTTGCFKLYTTDKLGGKWREPQLITDFDDDFEDICGLYMMADGVTLYFAGKSKNGLGGYDIYVTRYDQEDACYYKPENIGLPYNSRGNEYYYVIDEFNEIGWLVSDRNQPEDTVCVYTFVPTATRELYEDDLNQKKLERLARLSSIKDTWFDENARMEGLKRVAQINENAMAAARRKDDIGFVINDDMTYHSVSEFRRAVSKERYNALSVKKKELADTEATLELMREKYSASDKGSRIYMKGDILDAEKKIIELQEVIAQEEKEIRNLENTSL